MIQSERVTPLNRLESRQGEYVLYWMQAAQRAEWNHARDKREYLYSLEEFETARTHDPYWNAAEQEIVLAGKMHGYMRMYWPRRSAI